MRRKLKVKAETKEHTKRVIKRYAYFPKELKDGYFVWLESYYVEQTYYIWNRRGRWVNTDSWSESTEQRTMLDIIKGDENA
jgi:hypothetical protein